MVLPDFDNLNEWGDVEFITYGTGGEFGWTKTIQLPCSGIIPETEQEDAVVTTSSSEEGINPNSSEDRDAGKDVSRTTELRFNAWKSDPDSTTSDIIQLNIKLHDSHGNESRIAYVNNCRKECTSGTGMHPDRQSFISVKPCEYVIPLSDFDNGIIDFSNIVSVEFFLDDDIYNMSGLIEVQNLRFHKDL